MFVISELTDEVLAELEFQLPGCRFDDENQLAFLSADQSCDVQAAPGNGKTTLLVAKLILLSQTWASRTNGVCVISHTNAAREEIESKLAAHPTASALLKHPHFVGTVTSFFDRFIALPYLRGLGWPILRIDDDVFEAAALARLGTKQPLVAAANARGGVLRRSVESWVKLMEFAPDFALPNQGPLNRIRVKHRPRQHGPQTGAGAALEELKAELTKEGLYRYSDMVALSRRALHESPGIIDVLRRRFPLVILDEAQDTNGEQLALLNLLFQQGVAYQRLGDQNQTLYEDDELAAGDYWTAAAGAIPLNQSRRFGTDIATFASRLTVRAPQDIEGREDRPSRRSLLLFDQQSIARVLPAYCNEVRLHWGDEHCAQLNVRAVASRHNVASTAGAWQPRTLIDYCSTYRHGREQQNRPDSLCGVMRHAKVLHESQKPPPEVMDLVSASIASLLRRAGIKDPNGKEIRKSSLWAALARLRTDLPLQVRRLVRDRVIFGDCVWEEESWKAFCSELNILLGIPEDCPPPVNQFTSFPDASTAAPAPAQPVSCTNYADGNVRVVLGSVHSVKGKTVDAILMMETLVFRSNQRALDLTTVLPRAFGVANPDLTANAAHLAAATNVFVAVTRPKHLLCLAMHKGGANQQMLDAAEAQGWAIVDLTLPQAQAAAA